VPVFLNAAIDIYDTAGLYAKRDASISELSRLNPDFRYTYVWNMIRLFGDDQIDQLQKYIDHIDLSPWTTKQRMHAAVEWLTNSNSEPDAEVLQALSFRPQLALMAGRPDVFFDLLSGLSNGTKFPVLAYILNPNLPADETRRVHELPRTKALVKAMHLPEYWRKVGWPDMCNPLGEEDFECH